MQLDCLKTGDQNPFLCQEAHSITSFIVARYLYTLHLTQYPFNRTKIIPYFAHAVYTIRSYHAVKHISQLAVNRLYTAHKDLTYLDDLHFVFFLESKP